MNKDYTSDFSHINRILVEWYNQHKRDLPWRHTSDPYHIWLSETILQQTRVVQGLSYYNKFTVNYPTIKDLAAANEDDVLKLWQGLGYYSRARNLHHTAKIIASQFDGKFPTDYKTILSLKGIGDYTAAAIASFAFNLPEAAVDGNIYRVLSRLFAIDEPIDSSKGKKTFAQIAKSLLDPNNPGLHNQAIMEFGALQCIPVSPNCTNCPLNHFCLAFEQNKVATYPIKKTKTTVKERWFNYFDVQYKTYTYINKREKNDIWRNLYELPLIETSSRIEPEDLLKSQYFKEMFSNTSITIHPKMQLKHVLSHRIINAAFYLIEIDNDASFEKNFIKINNADIDKFAISRLVHKYLENKNTEK